MYSSILALTLVLDGGGWSVPRLDRFTLAKRPDIHYTGGWVGPRSGLDGCGKFCPLPPGFNPQIAQPIVSHYSGYTTPAHQMCVCVFFMKCHVLGNGHNIKDGFHWQISATPFIFTVVCRQTYLIVTFKVTGCYTKTAFLFIFLNLIIKIENGLETAWINFLLTTYCLCILLLNVQFVINNFVNSKSY